MNHTPEAEEILDELEIGDTVKCGPKNDVIGKIKEIYIDHYYKLVGNPKIEKIDYRVIVKIEVKSGIDPKYLVNGEKIYAIYNSPQNLVAKI